MADVSLLSDYLPILGFLLVFIVTFAVLAKTKILGENKWVQLFLAFLVATIFVTASGVREYVINITPWFAVFMIAMFFLLALIGLSGKVEFLEKGVGIALVIGLLVLFLVSAYFSFGATAEFLTFKKWITGSRIFGALILLIVSAVVSWILVKSK